MYRQIRVIKEACEIVWDWNWQRINRNKNVLTREMRYIVRINYRYYHMKQ